MRDDLAGSKYARRAELESWAIHREPAARLEDRRDPTGWTVVAIVPQSPETIVVASDPRSSIEEACVVVMAWLAEAGLNAPGAGGSA